jgi:transcriptional regulator with XRE-family HTH domain
MERNDNGLSFRITEIRDFFCNKDNQKFAKALGISVQLASSICTGNKPAGNKTLGRILNAYPIINKVWLVYGEGDMLLDENKSKEHKTTKVMPKDITATEQSNIERLITLLEAKDRQIEKLINLLEHKNEHIG